MANNAKYGVLLITGGRTHQENYAPLFAADPRCKLIGLTDEKNISAKRAAWNAELAAKLNIPVLPDLNEAITRDDVHIVSNCSEPERRCRIGVDVAKAGKHLYMDKPLGGNLQQLRDLVAAVAKSGIKSQMFSMLRFPWAGRALEVVQSGKLGELREIHADLVFSKGFPGTVPVVGRRKEQYPPERFDLVDSKREVFNTAIYSIAQIGRLTGRKVVDVNAVTANYFFREHYDNNVEDYGVMLLTLEGGLRASVTAGRIGWNSHPGNGITRFMLVGSKDTISIDAYKPRLEFWTDETPWVPPRRNPDDPMGFWSSTTNAFGLQPKRGWQAFGGVAAPNDASYFVDCIEQNRASDLDAEKAAHATEVIFASYKSATERKRVNLPLDM